MVTDKELVDLAAKGLKIESEPLKPVADKLGLTQEEVIERLSALIRDGKVRRFAASVRHQPVGYAHNAMVMVRTDEKHMDRVGRAAQDLEAVSHCYQRPHPDGDPWCVYVMVHGKDEQVVEHAVQSIKHIPGVKKVEVCRSTRELKKTSLSGVTTEIEDDEGG